MEDVSKQFKKTKAILETREFDFPQLKNFYNNISNSQDISEYEREQLIEIVTGLIHAKFPKRVKSIFGGKSEKAKILLEEVFNQLKKEFDWSKNKIGTRVKVGGDMIAGRQHVCWYISYKNDEGYSTGMHYRQLTPEDDPYLDVDYRRVGKDYEKDREFKKFPIQLKDEAINLYREYLKKTIK